MEDAHDTHGRPASGGLGRVFFGGARRCTERATNLYAEQGGEGQNRELRLMKAKVSRLERSSASYKRRGVSYNWVWEASAVLVACVADRLKRNE